MALLTALLLTTSRRSLLALPLVLALAPKSTTVVAFRPLHSLLRFSNQQNPRFLAPLTTNNAGNQSPTRSRFAVRMSSSSAATTTADTGNNTNDNVPWIPGSLTWHQTMLRVRDAHASVQFYRDVLGLTLVDTLDFPHYQFSLYFLTTWPADAEPYALIPGTSAAHDFLWNYSGVTLELTHNHGSEQSSSGIYHTGNQEKDGFGHIAVNVPDVYATSEKLLQLGIPFQKKPDEGRMKVRFWTWKSGFVGKRKHGVSYRRFL